MSGERPLDPPYEEAPKHIIELAVDDVLADYLDLDNDTLREDLCMVDELHEAFREMVTFDTYHECRIEGEGLGGHLARSKALNHFIELLHETASSSDWFHRAVDNKVEQMGYKDE